MSKIIDRYLFFLIFRYTLSPKSFPQPFPCFLCRRKCRMVGELILEILSSQISSFSHFSIFYGLPGTESRVTTYFRINANIPFFHTYIDWYRSSCIGPTFNFSRYTRIREFNGLENFNRRNVHVELASPFWAITPGN